MVKWTYSRWIASNSFIASLRPSLTALSSRCLCFSKDSSSLAHFLSSSSASYQDKRMVIIFNVCVLYSPYTILHIPYICNTLKKSGCTIIYILRMCTVLHVWDFKKLLWKFYTVNLNMSFPTGLIWNSFSGIFR